MTMRPRAAFTLVELLVVIAIIAILAALLMPALEGALTQARVAACAGNQHQIHLSLVAYTNDSRQCPSGPSWWNGLLTASWYTNANHSPAWPIESPGRVYCGLGRVYGYGYIADPHILVDPGHGNVAGCIDGLANLKPKYTSWNFDPIRPTGQGGISYAFRWWAGSFGTAMTDGRRLDRKHPDSDAMVLCYISKPSLRSPSDAHRREVQNSLFQGGHVRAIRGLSDQLDYWCEYGASPWGFYMTDIGSKNTFRLRLWHWVHQQENQ